MFWYNTFAMENKTNVFPLKKLEQMTKSEQLIILLVVD